MSYYGEFECLCKHYAQHLIELKKGTHYNKRFLKSYQDRPDGFIFFVLDWGKPWADQNLRLKRQDEYLLANKHRCYNIADTSKNHQFVQFKSKVKHSSCCKRGIYSLYYIDTLFR